MLFRWATSTMSSIVYYNVIHDKLSDHWDCTVNHKVINIVQCSMFPNDFSLLVLTVSCSPANLCVVSCFHFCRGKQKYLHRYWTSTVPGWSQCGFSVRILVPPNLASVTCALSFVSLPVSDSKKKRRSGVSKQSSYKEQGKSPTKGNGSVQSSLCVNSHLVWFLYMSFVFCHTGSSFKDPNCCCRRWHTSRGRRQLSQRGAESESAATGDTSAAAMTALTLFYLWSSHSFCCVTRLPPRPVKSQPPRPQLNPCSQLQTSPVRPLTYQRTKEILYMW